jgi:hypothetical protein
VVDTPAVITHAAIAIAGNLFVIVGPQPIYYGFFS